METPGLRWARRLLWLAVVAGFAFATSKTATDVQTAGLTPLDALRGGGPVAFWALSLAAHRPIRRGHGLAEIALVMFCVIAPLTAALEANPDPRATLLKAVPLVGTYLALSRLSRMYSTFEEAMKALATAIHALLVLVLVQWMAAPGLTYAPEALGGPPRLGSLVPSVSANPLGYAAVAGLLALVLKIGPDRFVRGVVMPSALTAGYILALLGTRTRTAIALGLLVLACALLAQLNRRPVLVVNTVLMAIAAALWFWPTQGDAVRDYLLRDQSVAGLSTLTGRTYLWDTALAEWSDHKITGIGFYSGHRLGLPSLSATQSNLDSTWVESLLDVGLLGTAPLAAFVVFGIIRVARHKPRSVAWWWAGFVAIYGVVISFVNPTLQAPGVGMLLLAMPILAAHPGSESALDEMSGGPRSGVAVPDAVKLQPRH